MVAFGCGQCMQCRVNRRRLWTHRIMLESLCHEKSSFWTLTYSPENVPDGGTLSPADLRNYLKRLRLKSSVRYFAVGEYGDETWRPHYHLALFGVGPCTCAIKKRCDCLPHTIWGKGHTAGLSLTPETAAYVAGYVTKKLTKRDDPALEGRYPEFARMSLRPGIGAPAIGQIAEPLSEFMEEALAANANDVPGVLKFGSKAYPLGRYLRARLRAEVGLSDGEAPNDWSVKASAEMCAVYKDYVAKKGSAFSLASVIADLSQERLRQIEGKAKIYGGKRKAGL